MGVTINEILQSKIFKDYHIIAGKRGIDREAQAVVLFDAPDGYKWSRGKELIISSGYFFKDDIDSFKYFINYANKKGVAGLGIKVDRYLKEIPADIIELCDELDFPLIYIPYDVPWINIIDGVNSIAINRFIKRINGSNYINENVTSSDFYKKIEIIIENLSKELKCPITLSDILDKNIINYPKNTKTEKEINSLTEDNLANYKKEILCEKLLIYRITDLDANKSWIEMAISLDNTPITKMIVWEDKRKIDYYDLFAMRLSYTLLLEIYAQIYVMNAFERKFYDDLLISLFNEELDTKEKLIKALKGIQNFKLNIYNKFVCIVIRQAASNPSFYSMREKIYNTLLLRVPKDEALFGIIDDNTIAIIMDVSNIKEDKINATKENISQIISKIEKHFESNLRVGIGGVTEDICKIKRSYVGALKAIEIGNYIYPEKKIVTIEELGFFGLFRIDNIEDEGFKSSFNTIYPLLKESNSEELINTLKVYLESESNYNISAQKLFIHSNTVRYRIAKIQEICNIDLEDPIERLKVEITLKFIDILRSGQGDR